MIDNENDSNFMKKYKFDIFEIIKNLKHDILYF